MGPIGWIVGPHLALPISGLHQDSRTIKDLLCPLKQVKLLQSGVLIKRNEISSCILSYIFI